MAAPLGNRNGAKGRDWADALKWALNNVETSSIKRGLALREIAKRVVLDALDGKEAAWREIGERLDGKVTTNDGQGSVKVLIVRDQKPEPIPIEAEVTRLPNES